MIIKNPTNNEISIQIFGTTYTVGPKGFSVDMPENVAKRWLEVHEFLIAVDKAADAVVEAVEDIKDAIDEIPDEIVEEAKEVIEKAESAIKKVIKRVKKK